MNNYNIALENGPRGINKLYSLLHTHSFTNTQHKKMRDTPARDKKEN